MEIGIPLFDYWFFAVNIVWNCRASPSMGYKMALQQAISIST
jgi:hypothetical protein